MIKVIVSDMDGTLFKDHKETIFNLSDRNEEALSNIQKTNVAFYVASGRMYSYGKKILEDHGFKDIVCSGFNGADIYDNGNFPSRYNLDVNIIKDVIQLIDSKYDYAFLQVQTLDCLRIFNNPDLPELDKYCKNHKLYKIDQVSEKTIPEFLETSDTDKIGKFSIILKNSADGLNAFNEIKGFVKDTCFVTMSSSKTIEICNKDANKGVFIQYLLDHYHYTKDEIAVIGDALNDGAMFPYVMHSFAMESGNEEIKRKAKYIVKDVAECIEICLNKIK